MGDLPILYSFRRCPYAIRARLALWEARRTVVLREVVLRNKPEQMLAISPKGTVPVLQTADGVIEESLDIIRWALDGHPWQHDLDAAKPLLEHNDGPFKHHLDRYKYTNRYDEEPGAAIAHRAAAVSWLQELDQRLSSSKGAGLIEGRFGLADICIAPFVRQFAFVDKADFDALPMPGLQAWLQRFLDSDRFAAVMPKWPMWEAGQDPVLFGADQ